MQSYNAIIQCNHTMQSYNGTERTNEHNIVKPDVDRSFEGNVHSGGITGWSLRHTERPDRTSMTFSIEGDVPTEGFDRRGGHGRCSAESALEKMLHPSGEIRRCYSLGWPKHDFSPYEKCICNKKCCSSREMKRYGIPGKKCSIPLVKYGGVIP